MLYCQSTGTSVSLLQLVVLQVIINILYIEMNNNFKGSTHIVIDDHDALKFLTYNLQSPDSTEKNEAHIPEDERAKLSQEFQDYQDKLQKQKDE